MGDVVTVDVGAVAHGGSCVARYEGRVVFVRHALPGERVRVRITDQASRFWRGDAVEVLDAAAGRVVPPCPYAGPGRCGGCDWQHARPDVQRELKAAVVAEQLRRLAGLTWPVEVEHVPGAGEDGLGWRTRVGFAVTTSGRPGLRRHRSHNIVEVDDCLIAHPGVRSVDAARLTWPHASSVEVVASAAGERLAVVTSVPGGPSAEVPRALHRDVSLVVDGERARGRGHVREQAAGRSWRVSGGGFWQVHLGAAETLLSAVLDATDPQVGETALDLYSGVGLFAGAIAERVGPGGAVTAVESDRRAVADARRNLHDLPQVRLVEARVDRWTPGGHADIVVLDPPRSGAGKHVVERIVATQPRVVGYVACDPAALARDLATFAGEGYRLDALRAFDLFPMTHHVECVATLRPTPSK